MDAAGCGIEQHTGDAAGHGMQQDMGGSRIWGVGYGMQQHMDIAGYGM